MEITCDTCLHPLEEPGALVFGPLDADGYCRKYHVCVNCWMSLYDQVDGQVVRVPVEAPRKRSWAISTSTVRKATIDAVRRAKARPVALRSTPGVRRKADR